MILMPISSYPMPADKNSQAQVDGERKSELTQQAQAVEQSPMSGRQKQRALRDIGDKISDAEKDAEQNRRGASIERRRKQEQMRKSESEKAESEKAETAKAEREHRFDRRV